MIVVGTSYAPAGDPLALTAQPERGTVSVYARGRDYHDVLKGRLRRLASWIAGEFACEVKLFVDTAPVMEKPLAARAGLGWQGKHTNVVSRDHGSWLFLGEIYTTLDLPPDGPAPDRCGTCRRCQDSCPTAAFPEPYRLDARRCISYLTIEHKGHIAPEFREADGQPHLWLRRLPGGVPLEQVRRPHARLRLPAAARADRAAPGRSRRARRRRVPRGVLGLAHQADRARPVRPQRIDRDRQFGRCRPRPRRRMRGLPTPRPSSGPWRCGRSRGSPNRPRSPGCVRPAWRARPIRRSAPNGVSGRRPGVNHSATPLYSFLSGRLESGEKRRKILHVTRQHSCPLL